MRIKKNGPGNLHQRGKKKLYLNRKVFGINKFFTTVSNRMGISERITRPLINEMNGWLFETLIKDGLVEFPVKIGYVYIACWNHKMVWNEKTKSFNPYKGMPDWGATYKLWKEDEEARLQGLILEYEPGLKYKIKNAKYPIKELPFTECYKFRLDTPRKKKFVKLIKSGYDVRVGIKRYNTAVIAGKRY